MSVLRGRLPPRRPNSPQSMAEKITKQRSCEGITIMMYVNEQNFGLGPLVVVLALHAAYFRDAHRSRDRSVSGEAACGLIASVAGYSVRPIFVA